MKLSCLGLSLVLLASCAADGSFASKSKPINKEQTRLAVCDGAHKIDIAFQAIAAAAPGVIPGQVMDAEGAFISAVGFKAGQPDAATAGTVCATVYAGDLDVAINTAILATVNISKLIQAWQK